MPTAKLAANFLERRSGELPSYIHGGLARKHVGAPIGTQGEFRIEHLSQVEVLAYVLADRLYGGRHRQGIKHHARRVRVIFVRLDI